MPDPNPVVAELWRGDYVESIHRGAWALVDTAGTVIDSAGPPDRPVFARSSSKSLQAVALFESGTAADLSLSQEELAVAVSSHNGQPMHVAAARSLLAKAGFDEDHLLCGPAQPSGSAVDAPAAAITNNCSGKHAGFLAVARALGDAPGDYLNPDSAVQSLVYDSVIELTGAAPESVYVAIDGCSAPTFRLPLAALARGVAQVANPARLGPSKSHACTEIVKAAGAFPELVGGTSTRRFDTEIIRASKGRLFAKSGADGVQVVGVVGEGVALAAKIDDGGRRALAPLVMSVLARHQLATTSDLEAMAEWNEPNRRNSAGLEIGHVALP